MKKHINKAKELAKLNISDDIIFNALAMECFQAVNSAIELGEYIVSEKNLGFPSKYKEVFELLYGEKIIDKKTLDDIKRLIFLRNLISYEYYTITTNELKEMVGLLNSLNALVKKAKDILRYNE
jgi:uncharacterized protein YutE (UPF0331/DUF86 family)